MVLDYKILGNRLKQARLSKDLTQEQLAEILDVSVAYISRVETGNVEIILKRLSQICSILDVNMGYILDGTSYSSKNYLNNDFNSLLKDCPPEKSQLIYEIAQVIIKK